MSASSENVVVHILPRMWSTAFGHAYKFVPNMRGQHHSHEVILVVSQGAVTFVTSTATTSAAAITLAAAAATPTTTTPALISIGTIPIAILTFTVIIAAVNFCLTVEVPQVRFFADANRYNICVGWRWRKPSRQTPSCGDKSTKVAAG